MEGASVDWSVMRGARRGEGWDGGRRCRGLAAGSQDSVGPSSSYRE
jgi:hypothetical protein